MATKRKTTRRGSTKRKRTTPSVRGKRRTTALRKRRTLRGTATATASKKTGITTQQLVQHGKMVGSMAAGGLGAHAVDNVIHQNMPNETVKRFSGLLLAVLFVVLLSQTKNKYAQWALAGGAVVALVRFVRSLLTSTAAGQSLESKMVEATTFVDKAPPKELVVDIPHEEIPAGDLNGLLGNPWMVTPGGQLVQALPEPTVQTGFFASQPVTTGQIL